MDWTQALTIAGMFVANIATVITLYIYSDSKAEHGRKDIMALIQAIHQEMKDFHGRLCSIEERSRK